MNATSAGFVIRSFTNGTLRSSNSACRSKPMYAMILASPSSIIDIPVDFTESQLHPVSPSTSFCNSAARMRAVPT